MDVFFTEEYYRNSEISLFRHNRLDTIPQCKEERLLAGTEKLMFKWTSGLSLLQHIVLETQVKEKKSDERQRKEKA